MQIKYNAKLLPVEIGQVIVIHGRVPADSERFNIDLHSGKSDDIHDSDVQLHLSVRYDCPIGGVVIVRNNYVATDGVYWQDQEEREQNVICGNSELNPIKRGLNFKMAIYVDKDVYFVTINEKPFCTFKHRMPIENIKSVRIFGDVDFVSVAQSNADEDLKPTFATEVKSEVKSEVCNC